VCDLNGKNKINIMRTQTVFTSLLVAASLVLGASVSQAADSKATGTWSWTQQGRGGQGGGGGNAPARKSTLVLKADGEKLTGTLTQPMGGRAGGGGGGGGGAAAAPAPVEISDGKIKGDEISFSVKREFNGNAFVTKYTGKVEGDKITGKVERPGRGGGEPTTTDWAATREAADKK
jgi:hypothetical protein